VCVCVQRNIKFLPNFNPIIQVRGAELCEIYLGCSFAFFSQVRFYVLWFLV